MKKLYVIALCNVLIGGVFAQNQFEWAVNFQGNSNQYAFDLVVDSQGSSISTGYFGNYTDFDPGVGTVGLTPVGGNDAFVCKLNTDGTLAWARQFGGTTDVFGYSIAVDFMDNIYVSGYFQGTADFDPGASVANLTSVGFFDAFVCKLTSNGDFDWVRQFSGASNVYNRAIEVDAAGNIYSTGEYIGVVDFDPGAGVANLTSNGSEDVYISKLDSNGDFIWAKSLGGINDDDVRGIALDDASNVYTIGRFFSLADFDPGAGTENLSSDGLRDVFISKLDANGDYVWAKAIGGPSSEETGNDITVDNTGNVYATGAYYGAVDLDPGPSVFNLPQYGNFDIFIAHLTNQGDFVMGYGIGGTSADLVYKIELDVDNGLYLAGSFSGTADFDPGFNSYQITSQTGTDPFILKLDQSLDFDWVAYFDGPNLTGQSRGLSVDANKNVYTAGHFTDTGDFDPDSTSTFNLTPMGGSGADIFVQKMSQCYTTNTSIATTSCGAYTSPGGNIWSASGVYEDTLVNSGGCDSILTINLTVTNLDLTVTNNDPLLTSNYAVGTYQWIDCATNQPISGATSQNFTPSANGNYAVIVTGGGCADTSSCYNVATIGLNEIPSSLQFSISPNPASDLVTIEWDEDQSGQLIVYDTQGDIHLFKENHQSGTSVDCSKLAKGIYFISLSTMDQKVVKMLVLK